MNNLTYLDKGVTSSHRTDKFFLINGAEKKQESPKETNIKNPWSRKNRELRDEIRRRLSESYLRVFEGTKRGEARASAIRDCETGHVLADGEILKMDERGPILNLRKCGNRHCPSCARRHGRRAFVRVADRIGITDGTIDAGKCRFLTLTRKSEEGETFKAQVEEVRSGFRKLRRRDFFTSKVDGFLFKLETTFSTPLTRRRSFMRRAFWYEKARPRGWREKMGELKKKDPGTKEHWNTHAHLFLIGKFLPVKELRAEWETCGKNLGHVWVRKTKMDGGLSALRETLKYSLKTFDVMLLGPELLDEYVKTTANCRFFSTGGNFHGAEMTGKEELSTYVAQFMEEQSEKIEEIMEGPCPWKSSKELATILEEGARGCPIPGASRARVAGLLRAAISYETEPPPVDRWTVPEEEGDWRWTENEDLISAAYAINAIRWEARHKDRELRRAVADAAQRNATYIIEGKR